MPDGLCQFESLSRFTRLAYREARRGRTCTAPWQVEYGLHGARRQHIGFETLLVYNVATMSARGGDGGGGGGGGGGALCVTCRNKRRLSLSLCSIKLFLRLLSSSVEALFSFPPPLWCRSGWQRRRLNERTRRVSICDRRRVVIIFSLFSELVLANNEWNTWIYYLHSALIIVIEISIKIRFKI